MNMNPQGGVANGAVRPNAGVDVSKQHLDARWSGEDQRWSNDAAGCGELTAKFKAAGFDLVVIEATGVKCRRARAGVRAASRRHHRGAREPQTGA